MISHQIIINKQPRWIIPITADDYGQELYKTGNGYTQDKLDEFNSDERTTIGRLLVYHACPNIFSVAYLTLLYVVDRRDSIEDVKYSYTDGCFPKSILVVEICPNASDNIKPNLAWRDYPTFRVLTEEEEAWVAKNDLVQNRIKRVLEDIEAAGFGRRNAVDHTEAASS